MVQSVNGDVKAIDIMLVTSGGYPDTVREFVDCLRPRFDDVEFVLPYKAMSAGALWALSGNRIWMGPNAYLGPIDPQTFTAAGRIVPAQAILHTLAEAEARLEEFRTNRIEKKPSKRPSAWIRLLDRMDPNIIGQALSSTDHVVRIAREFIRDHKFRDWKTRETSGTVVSDEDRDVRAMEVAENLCSSANWRAHSHGISRSVAEDVVQLRIDHLESDAEVARAVRRMWALLHWLFDNSPTRKLFVARDYLLVKNAAKGGPPR